MNLPFIPDPDARRIAAISALLQSDKDGEVLAAARKLTAALDQHGLRIGEVLLSALAGIAFDQPDKIPFWQAQARECLDIDCRILGIWNDRTLAFLRAMESWPRRPSKPQLRWLADLHRVASAGMA